jgi:hypothetical protein
MIHYIKNKEMTVELSIEEHGASIQKGNIGHFEILPSPIFKALVKNRNGESILISSLCDWQSTEVQACGEYTNILFVSNKFIVELSVEISFKYENDSIVWRARVNNNSSQWSVMSINYPTPVIKREKYDLFVPRFGGRIIKDASEIDYVYKNNYPGTLTMQYFALYSQDSGIYFGVEDEKAAVKNFALEIKEGVFTLDATFYATNGSIAGNSFDAFGQMRWKSFIGDWYDAAMIYADFVYKKAQWLPTLNRPDTPSRFKKVQFWISDYIPNIKSQGNNKPMLLSAGSDIYELDYWYKAPILLKKELGEIPIAYHVYNWHKIPFNIEYPHFLPAKETFIKNAPSLRENGIYVIPYINAVSWESRDGEIGHKINFDNTGIDGSVTLENGDMLFVNYPQMTKSGHNSQLVPMCPSFEKYHNIIEKLSFEMERTLPIDGIYFDEIAAAPARPCYNVKHNHTLGGGSYWVDGDNRMMQKIIKNKTSGNFYLTESCAEPYMKSFDGYLTWNWVYPQDVPAFAAIYAGYIQMIGRVTDGKKKEDLTFFKYCNGKSLVYGQQLGWCKADIVWRSEWLSFIKNAVNTRYQLTEFLNNAKMLRPPKVTAIHPKLIIEPGLDNKGNIESEAVVSGAWKHREREEIIIIAVNIANENVSFTLNFDAEEFGVLNKELSTEFSKCDKECTIRATLKNNEICVWKIK